MITKTSTELIEDYQQISKLAHETGEPIFITDGDEVTGVYMSIEVYEKHEERAKMLEHRASIFAAEVDRLSGGKTYTLEEVDAHVEELISSYEK